MPNTYTQIHIQLVFAVKYRAALIDKTWKERLHQYMTGIVQNNGHKLLRINGMSDHVHVLIGLRPSQSISELMQNLKRDSSTWINTEKLTPHRFAWQEGFGAFSYSHSHIDEVVKYIENQEEHHRKRSFLEEYKAFLQKFEIDFDELYIFKEPE
jgi:REP element-mobilizing transposase RayT